MIEFFWTGTVVGAVVGFLHMLYTLATRLGRPGLSPLKTFWQGIWTWLLWSLFGTYVLAFWIVGAVCLGASKLLKPKRGKP